jgi:DNA mismatch repair protein MutS
MKKESIHSYYFDLWKKHCKTEKDVLLLEVGSFYETYEFEEQGSAKIVSKELNIILTKKNGKLPLSETNPYMAGLHVSSIERHINLLLDNNFNVIIYSQDPKNPKQRNFKGRYTKNIRLDIFDNDRFMSTSSQEMKIYSMIVEKYQLSRNKIKLQEYKLTMVMIDMYTGKLFFSETIDSNYLSLIDRFFIQHNANELIVFLDKEIEKEERNDIEKVLHERKNLNFRMRDYKTYSQDHFEVMLEKIHSVVQSSNDITDLPYFSMVILNISFLIQYIEEHDPIQIQKLSIENPWLSRTETNMQFNRDLFKELFLFQLEEEDRGNQKSIRCMFDLLSKDMNKMGKRVLTSRLQAPLICSKQIQERYNEIESIKIQPSILKECIDIESYYLKWKRGQLSTRLVAKLLKELKLLQTHYQELVPFLDYIDLHFDIDNMMLADEEYLLNPSTEYLVYLQNYKEELETMKKLNSSFTFVIDKQHGIENSYYTVTTSKWNKVTGKENFRIIAQKSTIKHVMYIDYEDKLFLLKDLEDKIKEYKDAYFKRISMEIMDGSFDHLITCFINKVKIDSMNCCLREFFLKWNYTKPNLKDKDNDKMGYHEIDSMRHPLIERIFPDEVFVPFSSHKNKNVSGQLIYGMNSSGKSTYMKSTALNLWLAQCGFYVSCKNLTFYPYKAMFSKMNRSDNLFKKQSLYFSEIFDIKYILDRAKDSCLLFFDEIFSGTEVNSASSLLIAIIQKFCLQSSLHFYITTHIHQIADVVQQQCGNRVQINHFEMKDLNLLSTNNLVSTSENIFYNRLMKDGSGPSLYGIEVAEKLLINNQDIIQNAYSNRQHIKFSYQFIEKKKTSKYNKKVAIEECQICKSRTNLHTHHIVQQQNFDSNLNLNGFHMNSKQNLIVLCASCHRNVENQIK